MNTTERKPGMGIDSLLANAIEKLRGQLCGEGELASELEEARAAVAELIEALRGSSHMLRESAKMHRLAGCGGHAKSCDKAADKANAALARVGGAE